MSCDDDDEAVPFQLIALIRRSPLLWFDASGASSPLAACVLPSVQKNQDHFNEAWHGASSELARSSHQGRFNTTWL